MHPLTVGQVMMLNATVGQLVEVKSGTVICEFENGKKEFAIVDAKAGDVTVHIEEWEQGSAIVHVSGTAGQLELAGIATDAELSALIESLICARSKARAIGFLQ